MKFYHSKDRELFFEFRRKPSDLTKDFIESAIDVEDGIDSVIEKLIRLKSEGYSEIYSDPEYGLILHKFKTKEELAKEKDKLSAALKEWEVEYNSKMQILEQAYQANLKVKELMRKL